MELAHLKSRYKTLLLQSFINSLSLSFSPYTCTVPPPSVSFYLLSLSLSVCLSVCLSVYMSLSIFAPLSISFYFSLFLSRPYITLQYSCTFNLYTSIALYTPSPLSPSVPYLLPSPFVSFYRSLHLPLFLHRLKILLGGNTSHDAYNPCKQWTNYTLDTIQAIHYIIICL